MLTTMNLPNGLIAHGFQVLGSPTDTTGSVFYVSSTSANSADDTSHGQTRELPFLTWGYAISRCTANNGDVIVLMPGHVETVIAAAGLAINIAGITHWALGHGASRPKVNFTTVVGASMVISAASQTIVNVLFTGGIDALTNPVHLQAADIRLIGCETRDVTGQATDFIVTTAAADRLLVSGWTHRGASAAGADTAISIVGGDSITIESFWIDGNFAVGAIENVTTAATNITIGGGPKANYIHTRNAADVAVTLVATTTGNVGPNINAMLTDNAANITEAFVAAAGWFFQPINIVNLAGESSMQTNITASTDA